MTANIHYVNNTPTDIRGVFPFFAEAYKTGVLPEAVADLFAIRFVDGLNADGSRRMIVEAA